MLHFVVIVTGAYQLTRWLFALLDLLGGGVYADDQN